MSLFEHKCPSVFNSLCDTTSYTEIHFFFLKGKKKNIHRYYFACKTRKTFTLSQNISCSLVLMHNVLHMWNDWCRNSLSYLPPLQTGLGGGAQALLLQFFNSLMQSLNLFFLLLLQELQLLKTIRIAHNKWLKITLAIPHTECSGLWKDPILPA